MQASRAGQRDYKFSATTLSDIQKYIPSFKKEYEGKLIIENDEIVYVDVNLNNKELQWLNELEIKNNISEVLPKEYQKVEYIEGHGIEYIDSKVIPITGEKCSINIDFQLTKLIDNTWICGFFGDTSGVLECGIWAGTFYNSEFSYSQVSNYFERTTATGVGNKNDLKYSILIFARMSHTLSDYRPANVKVYSAQISIDDILVRDFIPCYRKSDGEGGLYDKVTKQFYTNKGTGSFTYKVK